MRAARLSSAIRTQSTPKAAICMTGESSKSTRQQAPRTLLLAGGAASSTPEASRSFDHCCARGTKNIKARGVGQHERVPQIGTRFISLAHTPCWPEFMARFRARFHLLVPRISPHPHGCSYDKRVGEAG